MIGFTVCTLSVVSPFHCFFFVNLTLFLNGTTGRGLLTYLAYVILLSCGTVLSQADSLILACVPHYSSCSYLFYNVPC
jgi:hypothetical protein